MLLPSRRRLVLKLNDLWGLFEVEGDLVPLPLEPIRCPFCGSEMILHDFRAYKHHHPEGILCHVDVHLKCPRCGFHHYEARKPSGELVEADFVFGLPIPCDLLPRLYSSRFHGKVLRWELSEIYGERREIEERLRSWGYW